jgi:pimeloyl-ACP methyl ester carboxylesterase
VDNDGVNLVVDLYGEGPTILLMHGWPDTSKLWDDVVPDLVAAGYRVAVPDLRGCGRSDKPADVSSYQMHHLVSDVAGVIEALGSDPVVLVGHDWGAALAWASATLRPDLVRGLVAISVGHPSSFRSAGLAQQLRSWYMLLFHFEGLGEAFLRKNDHEAMHRWLKHPRVNAVIAELERDGQMEAHLRWYRANVPPDAFVAEPRALPLIEVPVLGVWSSGDFALTEVQMTNSASYCARGFAYVRLEGLGHWIPLEAPHDLAREIVAFASSLASDN